jgi:hypothetical protein
MTDSTKQEIENQFKNIEEIPSKERMINAPQGSIASDIQQADDISDIDRNSDIEQNNDQQLFDIHENSNQDQPITDDINNLKLDADEVS